ncbi:MAG: fatty acid CoA ligase family protein, partial [Thermodesulfobacteriota bacterium]|nr:fatty acid CoA ligase family protein [Thermodesulfobacteriota bacterium]
MENGDRVLNIASYLPEMAKRIPFKRAIVFPHSRDSKDRVSYTHLTYKQLNQESDLYAYGLTKMGIKQGSRVVLMVRPGLEFIGLTFALFKIGAIPVLIDPGIGKSSLVKCIKEVEPEAFIGVSLAHALRIFYGRYFKGIKYYVTIGRRWFWGGATLDRIREKEWKEFPVAGMKDNDPAAILFTTGSTGPPKGVVYRHKMFDAQVTYLKNYYNTKDYEVDMPTFPLFALFSICLGMTCIIPDMNPTRPALADPLKIIEAINNQGVTNIFGSPALFHGLSLFCIKNNIKLPSIKRILIAGAPVSGTIISKLKQIIEKDADVHTPYGATEALPLTSINGTEILYGTLDKTLKGAGICVGKPFPDITLKIIKIYDGIIPEWNEDLTLPEGKIGEIAAKGSVVTEEYYKKEKLTALAKIYDGDAVWHRMGDVGYMDALNRIWFCGRKSHLVITKNKILFPVCCEAIFNQHKDVYRSALVGVGPRPEQRPVIIIEPEKGKMPGGKKKETRFKNELLSLGSKNPLTAGVKDVLFHPSFPVDI